MASTPDSSRTPLDDGRSAPMPSAGSARGAKAALTQVGGPCGAQPYSMEHLWIGSESERLATSLDLPASSPPWPVAVLVHGFSGHRIGRSYLFVELGRRLTARGVACVRFDHAGCGESSGDQMRFGLRSMERDVLAVHDHLRADGRFELARLALVGVSMGALGALALDASRGSRGMVLLGPVYDLPTLVQSKVPDEQAIAAVQVLGYAPYRGVRLGAEYFAHLDHLNPAALLAKGSSPLLVIHAADDEVVPAEHSRAFAKACAEIDRPCHLVEFDGAAHDFHEEPLRTRMLETAVRRIAAWVG